VARANARDGTNGTSVDLTCVERLLDQEIVWLNCSDPKS